MLSLVGIDPLVIYWQGERVVCNNAPCVKPLTYHTIGYRVEDSADKYSHSDTFYR